MQKKKENFRPLRSVTTFALAAAIITGSIYTVAAAVNYSAETEHAVTSDGVELANGDIVYAGLDENGFTYGMIRAVEISVDKDSNIEDADSITIKRVTYRNETETQSVDFETVKKNSKDVDLGKTKVQTEGKQGEALVTKKCKYVDGKKVSSETVDTKITKEPVDKVVLMGTKGSNVSNPVGTFTDMNGNTVAYSSVVTGSGTAYTAPAGSLTATGVTAYHGGVAVNPNIIPYGSKLYIVSTDGSFVYGYATAVDTGGALMSGTAIVDCFYNTYDECVSFGRRNVNVYIVG